VVVAAMRALHVQVILMFVLNAVLQRILSAKDVALLVHLALQMVVNHVNLDIIFGMANALNVEDVQVVIMFLVNVRELRILNVQLADLVLTVLIQPAVAQDLLILYALPVVRIAIVAHIMAALFAILATISTVDDARLALLVAAVLLYQDSVLVLLIPSVQVVATIAVIAVPMAVLLVLVVMIYAMANVLLVVHSVSPHVIVTITLTPLLLVSMILMIHV